MLRLFFFLLGNCLWLLPLAAQTEPTPKAAIDHYFRNYRLEGYRPRSDMKMERFVVDSVEKCITIVANESFTGQPFTEKRVASIYTAVRSLLPTDWKLYDLFIQDGKKRKIEDLIPNYLRTEHKAHGRLWKRTNYNDTPWVTHLSKPYAITQGLNNRHLCVWHSHGRYYDSKERRWKWQRPYLFCTTEDLFTQSIVLPYLLPMLENAGAIVTTPKERDKQRNEVVVDNDRYFPNGYVETALGKSHWSTVPMAGFASPFGEMSLDTRPFSAGTARMAETTTSTRHLATITWRPQLPEAGEYAVYVSYKSLPNSTEAASYRVHHAGGITEVRVNQRMGGDTWVYLGTYHFIAGMEGSVQLSNLSDENGKIVVADAVRFGGGMGSIGRGEQGTSGFPRFLEAARYYTQWAGAPDSLWNKDAGTNDYNDDLRARGNYVNWLAGASEYIEELEGQRVPLELSLAVHSDAGAQANRSVHGSLAIYTQKDNRGNILFPQGMERQASGDLGALVLAGLHRDLSATFGINWTQRELWDRNYAESRIPDVPSIILETLSHQNFTDMRYGHDPLFKFAMARSIYKSLLRYIHYQHGSKRYVVQPLPVHSFSATLTPKGVQLSWQPQKDALEPTATPEGYVVYTRLGDGGFNNGVWVKQTSVELPLTPGQIYSFKVTAVNKGGESFASETLSAYRSPHKHSKEVLIINGFDRVSGPAIVDTPDSLGFCLEKDYGVPYRYTTAFSGAQQNFSPTAYGKEGARALGFSSAEWEGRELAGNTFDYPYLHGTAMAHAGYSFSSVSRDALTSGIVPLLRFAVVDYIGGLQQRNAYNLRPYPVFPPAIQELLRAYTQQGGRLFVSGSFLSSDLRSASDKAFGNEVLKIQRGSAVDSTANDTLHGANYSFTIYRTPNATQLAALSPEVIEPSGSAFSSLAYSNGHSAAVAYRGKDFRVITLGFPFETIREAAFRQQLMRASLQFLTQ